MRSAGPGRAHHIFLVRQPRAAFPRLMISGLRLFSKRHSTASMALAPAFDRRHPDCPNRFPTMCLQTLPRRRIRPAIRVRGRGRSAFGPCWPRSGGRGPRRLPPELRPADGAVRPDRKDAEEGRRRRRSSDARARGRQAGGSQRRARHWMLLRKHAPARLPRLEGRSCRRRPTQENGMHPRRVNLLHLRAEVMVPPFDSPR